MLLREGGLGAGLEIAAPASISLLFSAEPWKDAAIYWYLFMGIVHKAQRVASKVPLRGFQKPAKPVSSEAVKGFALHLLRHNQTPKRVQRSL